MIQLTRLAGQPLVVNVELIKTVEATPDTMVTLINGDRIMVKESIAEVVSLAIEYCRQVRCFTIPVNGSPSGGEEG